MVHRVVRHAVYQCPAKADTVVKVSFGDLAGRDHPAPRRDLFPLGAAISLADLDHDPHPWLARLRDTEPVSWLPVLNGWLVTRHDLAVAVTRDSATFTVDDPRFTTARVVGPSMLSLDGTAHGRHRAAFTKGFGRGVLAAGRSQFHCCAQGVVSTGRQSHAQHYDPFDGVNGARGGPARRVPVAGEGRIPWSK